MLFNDAQDDPDVALVPAHKRDLQRYDELFALQERAFRRAGTVMRRWIRLEHLAMSAAADHAERERLRGQVIERLVSRQLRLLGEAEARRADYRADPPPSAGKQHMPIMLAGELGVVALVALLVRRLVRRKKR